MKNHENNMENSPEFTSNQPMKHMSIMGKFLLVLFPLLLSTCAIWFLGSRNPVTPAGYIGYLTQDAIFGKSEFFGMQKGPTSPGRTWLLKCVNISVTPFAFMEEFRNENSVLSRDNLKIAFKIHVVWRIKSDMVKEFVERFSTMYEYDDSDKIVQTAYKNYIREILCTYARDEVQKLNGLEMKNQISEIGQRILERTRVLASGTPFEILSVVVGNIQYPEVVATAVAEKLASSQILERKKIEIEIEQQEKAKRVVQAEGLAKAMELVNQSLTSQYIQHEAIEAQKMMVNSPNHTTIYIPVGPMGVPVVATTDAQSRGKSEPLK